MVEYGIKHHNSTPDITEIQKEKQKIEIITRQIISKLIRELYIYFFLCRVFLH